MARKLRWPFKAMKVGDSFVADIKEEPRLRRSAYAFAERNGWMFRTKTVRSGLLVRRAA